MSQPLEELGRDVAEALGEPLSDARRLQQRQAFVETIAAGAPGSRRKLVLGFAAAAVTLGLVAVSAVVITRLGEPVPFWVGSDPTASTGAASLRALPDAPLPLRFADGTELSLAPNGRANVQHAAGGKVAIEVVEGRLTAAVRHKSRYGWTFIAGAYEVRVTGTRLTVEPAGAGVAVEVTEGSVRVRGPGLDGGRDVHAGERLTALQGVVRLEPVTPAPAPPEEVQPIAPVPPETPAAPTGDRRPQKPALSWRQLAELGRYREALDATEREGFGPLLERLSAADLAMLADTARFARNAEAGQRALAALEKRFPGSRESERASFLSGRIAVELEGDAARGAASFERYLARAPKGEFAEEALGRLVAALATIPHRRDAAQARARSYLEQYPTGTYAAIARSVLASERR